MEDSFKKTAEAYKSMQLARKQLARLEQRIEEAKAQLRQLDRVVDQEYKEYETLEKAGMRKLFKKVLGKGDEQLEKEKQDYLEAVLNYNQKKKELELFEFERRVLADKVKHAHQINRQFDEALKKYTRQLVEQDTAAGQKLMQLEKQIQAKLQDRKEVDEALESGNKVRAQLEKIVKYLNKAGWWGAPEWKKGNPLKVAADKIEYIDRAVKLIPIANHQLLRFIDELKDIYLDDESKLDYNQTAFSRFSGGFYDSLIIDWILKGKAQNALHVVVSTRDKLDVTLKTLALRNRNIAASVKILRQRKRDIVLKDIGE